MEQSYKEKYEQAIERLKQWDREHPCAGYVLSDRDKFIFPELAENKDEKVRKELINFLCELGKLGKNTNFDRWNKADCANWIAWLEKQGQVKESAISQHENRTCEENDDSLTSEDERIREALVEMVHDTTDDGLWVCYNVHKEEALAWLENIPYTIDHEKREGFHLGYKACLEKQGEKLPVGFYYVNSEGKKFYSDTLKYGDVILHVEKQGEQKQKMEEQV